MADKKSDTSKYELIITEKPSVAKKMAEDLADGKVVQKREGQVGYFEITHKGNSIIITSAVGHLFTVSEVEKGKWNYPVFDIKWVQSAEVNKAAAYTKQYADTIKKLSKNASEFTVATDYDIEGEVIGYNVIRFLCGQKDASRMKFSALTKQDLNKSYDNKMKTIDWPQAMAGTTRHELDWFYGINLSRALSAAIKKAGMFKILSSGRVQGPALKILCDKERDITGFKPEPYFEVILNSNSGTKKEIDDFIAEYEKNPLQKKEDADKIAKKTSKKPAVVSSIDVKRSNQEPPTPFDLTTIQMEAYRAFGIQPKDTLALLQDLYIGGWTSYPRTSSQKLPKELDFPTILKNLARMPVYEKLANFLLDKNKKKALTPNEGDKVDDAHPAIYPTGLSPQNITPRHEKMYDLVVKRFFATFGDPAVRESVKATIEVEKENFICKGTRTVEKNWHLLYEPYVKFEEIELPHFVKGQSVENKEISVLSKETKPPKRYTPASIIKELEKRGLGTKATRAAIVDNLFDRGYVNEKSIKATTIGIQTCEVLEKYCPEILDEQLTREIEDEMEDIRHKKKKPEEVKEHAIKFLTKTLIDFKKKEKEIGKGLLGASKDANSFAKCPNCEDGNILMRKGKFGRFLGCSNYPDCKTTYKLPQNGKITQTEQEAGKLLIKVQMPKKGAELIDLLTMNNNNNTSDGGAANSNNKNNPANDENRPKVTGEGDICAKCGKGKMTLRKSFHGFFLGCSNYPECKTIIPLKREEIIALAKPKENTEEKKEE